MSVNFIRRQQAFAGKKFIADLDLRSRRKFYFVTELLEEFGHKLPEPHAKYLKEDIYELRMVGSEGQIRVLYFFFHKDSAIFVSGFIKKTQKLPDNEFKVALERKKDFLQRHK